MKAGIVVSPLVTSHTADPSRTFADSLAGELYAAHFRALVRYVRRLTGDQHRGEDLAQETMLRAWQHAEKLLHDDAAVRGWLYRVARNIVVDDLRARRRRPTEVLDDLLYQNVGVTDPADRLVARIDMDEALSRLTPKHRSVLVEVFYYGRTVDEAAEVLCIPQGTAKSRVRLGLQDLRRRLQK